MSFGENSEQNRAVSSHDGFDASNGDDAIAGELVVVQIAGGCR
jgi:hypothetical protein